MSKRHVHRMRVRYAECDPQNIVFNSRYLEYFDVAMTELWREAIGPWEPMMGDLGVDMVVAETGLRFRGALGFDDEFELHTEVRRLGTTSMTTAIAVIRDGETCVEGEIRHVFVHRSTTAKREIPPEIRAALEPYVAVPRSPDSGSLESGKPG